MEAGAEGNNAKDCPAEYREWVEQLRQGGAHPLSAYSGQTIPNSWACPPGHAFSLRGPDYHLTRAKTTSGECLLQPLAFDFLQGPSPITHIMQHPRCRVRSALSSAAAHAASSHDCQHQPFVWAFNIQLGNKAHHSFVYYFVSFRSPPPGSLMQRFLDGDDTFRNSRLKCLIRIPEAPSLVQLVVGQRWPVCMLGKVMRCTYTREKNYIEVDVDAASSILTRTAVKLTFGLTPLCVADIAFLLEGTSSDELPERILGAARLVKVEPSSAAHIDM